MPALYCRGRQGFDELMPFGSEKNRCPFGLDVQCSECKFYEPLLRV